MLSNLSANDYEGIMPLPQTSYESVCRDCSHDLLLAAAVVLYIAHSSCLASWPCPSLQVVCNYRTSILHIMALATSVVLLAKTIPPQSMTSLGVRPSKLGGRRAQDALAGIGDRGASIRIGCKVVTASCGECESVKHKASKMDSDSVCDSAGTTDPGDARLWLLRGWLRRQLLLSCA